MNESLYFSFVFLGALYVFHKVGIKSTSILIVLIFWSGLFHYFEHIVGTVGTLKIHDIYKIIVVAYALKLSWPKIFLNYNKFDKKINLIFILFTISFWITYFLYGGKIITILSQYLFKYGLTWILYHYFKDILINDRKRKYIKHILLLVLYVQIALSIIKLSIFGLGKEYIVGSMAYIGGGLAVVIPIVALIFYWLIKEGKFKKSDWIVVILIFLIALASGKRQPMIFYPLVLFVLLIYRQKHIRPLSIIKYLPIVFIILYIGLRLTPSLNPEGKVWGSFDLSHVQGYALKYYFGTSETEEIFNENYKSYGRGGAIVTFFKPQLLNLNTSIEMLFGKGRYKVAVGSFTADERQGYNIKHSGLIGDAGAILYSFGYFGTILMIFLAISIIKILKNNKLALVIILFYLWEFLFYYNQVIYSNQSIIIVLFTIFYGNYINYRDKKMMHKPEYKKV
jgi:hypothetical protein